MTASRFLDGARNCLGRTFEGYKGGDFVMAEDTPLWTSHYGCTGRAITGISLVNGEWVIRTMDIPA